MWEKIVTHKRQFLSLSRLAVMRQAMVPLPWVHKSAQSPLTGVLVGKSGPHSTFCTLECHYVATNTYLYWDRFPKVCLSRPRTSLCGIAERENLFLKSWHFKQNAQAAVRTQPEIQEIFNFFNKSFDCEKNQNSKKKKKMLRDII